VNAAGAKLGHQCATPFTDALTVQSGKEKMDRMNDAPTQASKVSLAKLFGVFLYIGATSFGGGVIAYLQEFLVTRQKWLDEDHFLAALEIGQTVPGLISTNVAVIVGSRLRGVRGAIIAAVGMTLPGAIFVFILGLLYAQFKNNPEVGAVLDGVGAAAVGLILAVTLQMGAREIRKWQDWIIMVPAFAVVGVFHISLVPVLAVLVPISIQFNRPEAKELAAYHTQQASYHAQLAEHHEEVAARHAAPGAAGSPS
jgi:chromate transporter